MVLMTLKAVPVNLDKGLDMNLKDWKMRECDLVLIGSRCKGRGKSRPDSDWDILLLPDRDFLDYLQDLKKDYGKIPECLLPEIWAGFRGGWLHNEVARLVQCDAEKLDLFIQLQWDSKLYREYAIRCKYNESEGCFDGAITSSMKGGADWVERLLYASIEVKPEIQKLMTDPYLVQSSDDVRLFTD